MAAPFVVEKASLLCSRLFDVAENLDLDHARRLLAQDSRTLKLGRAGSEYLVLSSPPLTVALGRNVLTLKDGQAQVEVSARLFDYGAVSFEVCVPVAPGATFEGLIPRADEVYDSPAIDALCEELLGQLRATLEPALESVHQSTVREGYTVLFVERVAGNPTGAQLLTSPELPRLMLGEAGRLSSRESADVLEHHFSYTENDLVVIDWNSAFVYEPSGSTDIPYLLELVNAQLLELRWFDEVLESQLKTIYTEISRRRRSWYSLLWSPYRALSRRVLVTLLDLSEFVERVDNTLKIVGDFYLAKVYEAAVAQLRIRPWQHSVTRKLELLQRTYNLLKGEVDTDRVLLAEVTVVLLIVTEIALAIAALMK